MSWCFFEGQGERSGRPCYSLLKLGSVGRYCAGFLQIGKGARGHDRVTNPITYRANWERTRKICQYLKSDLFRPEHHSGTSALVAGWLRFGPSAMRFPKTAPACNKAVASEQFFTKFYQIRFTFQFELCSHLERTCQMFISGWAYTGYLKVRAAGGYSNSLYCKHTQFCRLGFVHPCFKVRQKSADVKQKRK